MTQRYFIELKPTGSEARLLGDEARHLAQVMRAKPGDEVTLFDGQGWEYQARVETVGRGEVGLQIIGRAEVSRETSCAITLGVALPKGERQRWLVEKLVELGVARLVPLRTERGVAQPGEQALKRLRRAVVEASKQCGRNRLLQVADAMRFDAYLAAAPQQVIRWLAHPGGERLRPATCRRVEGTRSVKSTWRLAPRAVSALASCSWPLRKAGALWDWGLARSASRRPPWHCPPGSPPSAKSENPKATTPSRPMRRGLAHERKPPMRSFILLLLATVTLLAGCGPISPPGNSAAPASAGQDAAPVKLSLGVALPITLPSGTTVSFSVNYRFLLGGPNPRAKYLWVIQDSQGQAATLPVQLQRQGELKSLSSPFRPEQGPFSCHLAEAPPNAKPHPISATIPLK